MRFVALVLAAALTACATGGGGDEIAGQPSLEVSANVPAPERARFYADCIAQAAAEHTYFREEHNDELLRFNCDGDVAERFFAGLAERAAAEGSEMVVGIRTWRFSNRIQRDTIGLDYCWRDSPNVNAEPLYACTVVLNVGSFLKD
ncbi:hypothetical protein [Terricaulis silvestris]|uniref:Lipoprotein n=1 Tax=Terricaulis silvestris TaxID=2686094 RepID=A0A6I6MLJ5_9CAUL|nr:hypothetical protein [Terricaulis silvestris]QGZ94871.1 hypothetical protein DSM104635_01703 [Terricaulis silvestris]